MLLRKTAVAITTGILSLGMVSAASADNAGEVIAASDYVSVVRDGDWVRHDYKENLGGEVTTHTYNGIPTRLGCSFEGSDSDADTSDPGVVFEERQVAVNLVNCTLVTETGIALDQSESVQEGLATATDSVKSPNANVSTQKLTTYSAVALASTTRTLWQKTSYEDVVGLELNSSKVNLSWTYNGSCVTASTQPASTYFWRNGTGWSKVSGATTYSRTCTEAYSRSTSEFLNQTFCLTIDTRTKFWPNKVSGHEDGTRTNYWIADAWGGCSGTVSFHRTYSSL